MRKMIVISMAILAIVCLSATVSAGLFDFGGSAQTGEVTGKIQNSAVDMEIKEADTNGSDLDGIYFEDIYFNGTIEIDLINATDDQISYIEENIDNLNITTEFTTNQLTAIFDLEDDDGASYKFDGKTLTISFDGIENSMAFENHFGNTYSGKIYDANVTIPTGDGNITIIA